MDYLSAFPALADQLAKRGVDVRTVLDKLKKQHIETPSWGYGNSGTRFKVFSCPGAARDIHEKLADAGLCPQADRRRADRGHPHPVGQDRTIGRR